MAISPTLPSFSRSRALNSNLEQVRMSQKQTSKLSTQ